MLAKTNEALIAQAQEAARNKRACSHVNAAHAAMIAFLINNPPPAFSINPDASDMYAASEYLAGLARAADEIVYQVTREASFNSSKIGHVSSVLITDTLNDADVFAYLSLAADELNEDVPGRSDYAEHSTLHRAAQGV